MLDRGQIPRQTRRDWRWIALLVSPVAAIHRHHWDRSVALGTTTRTERPLDIRAASYGQWWAMVAARERGSVPGSAAPYGADARSTASSLGNLALPFSFVLASFSNPAHVGAVSNQTALCSAVFHFLLARTLSAYGLRNCPPSSCRAASARSLVFADSFFSGNRRLLQAGSGYSTRRLASRDTILAETIRSPAMPCCFTFPWDECHTSFIARCNR